MTPELQQRLDNNEPPFDGKCIRNSECLTLNRLRELIRLTIEILNADGRSGRLCSYHDWHDHDGLIVESNDDSWDTLNSATFSNRTLYDSRNDDFAVRIAYFNPDFDWLLRYNIDSEDERDYTTASCDFDLSVRQGSPISHALDRLLQSFPNILMECESSQWFRSVYGG